MRTMTRTATVASLLFGLLGTVGATAAHGQDFEWRGSLDAGSTLEVRGVIGGIEAVPATGRQVVVTAALREGRRGDVEDVDIEVVEHAGGVTICAVYPDRPGRTSRCAPGDSQLGNYRNDTKVEFRLEVPESVNLVAGTVNGGIDVRRLAGDVRASTVNGDVEVASAGLVEARTVNGSIRAAMEAELSRDVSFETVNGSVTVSLPSDASADVEASTVNGSMDSDFPLTVQGRFSNRRMHGTIGDGGRRLKLETVNGSVAIRRT